MEWSGSRESGYFELGDTGIFAELDDSSDEWFLGHKSLEEEDINFRIPMKALTDNPFFEYSKNPHSHENIITQEGAEIKLTMHEGMLYYLEGGVRRPFA